MAEVWAAAAISVVGGVMAGKAAEKKDKSDKAHQEAMTKEESALAAQRTGYERALEDFYTQKERARKQRGLDQFRQFNSMSRVSPGYDINSEVRINEGEAPNYNTFDPDYNPNATEVDPATGQKNSKSLLDKRKDLHKKARDPLGLF